MQNTPHVLARRLVGQVVRDIKMSVRQLHKRPSFAIALPMEPLWIPFFPKHLPPFASRRFAT